MLASLADVLWSIFILAALLGALAAMLAFYFLPSIVALKRQVPNVGSVVVINTLLGWTFIGWVVALAMAARSRAWPFGA
jgi:hypothetical protein